MNLIEWLNNHLKEIVRIFVQIKQIWLVVCLKAKVEFSCSEVQLVSKNQRGFIAGSPFEPVCDCWIEMSMRPVYSLFGLICNRQSMDLYPKTSTLYWLLSD